MKKSIDTHLDFSFEKNPDKEFLRRALGRISLSGVQEKFSAVIDGGKFRLARDGEQGTWILKPAPMDLTLDGRKHVPVNEYITMTIARRLYGIVTAEVLLCEDSSGQNVLAVRRFDVQPDGRKLPQEDFASVLGRSGTEPGGIFKYTGDYAEIAAAIRRYISAWPPAVEDFFRLVLFNYIYANGDAHLKNFSILRQGPEYILAPAYNLLNTELHIKGCDFALSGGLSQDLVLSDIYSTSGHPCRADFEQFGEIIGLKPPRIKKVISQFMALPEEVGMLLRQSPFPDKMQRSYLRIIKERLARINR
ncbi:MAG: HipA domain-containing protein [Bacteroidales bacterium]|nr:HipA domain-containing protein [Bacteroidales bacterium]